MDPVEIEDGEISIDAGEMDGEYVGRICMAEDGHQIALCFDAATLNKIASDLKSAINQINWWQAEWVYVRAGGNKTHLIRKAGRAPDAVMACGYKPRHPLDDWAYSPVVGDPKTYQVCERCLRSHDAVTRQIAQTEAALKERSN